MKKLTTLLLLLSFYNFFAQEKTLVSSGITSNGWFGAPVMKIAELNNQSSLIIGARGGWIINNSIVLGGGMYGLASNVTVDVIDGDLFSEDTENLHFMYGGFELEYIISPMEIFHVSLYTLLGLGSVSYNNFGDGNTNNFYSNHQTGNSFFIAEPAINLEVNVTHFFRIDLGVGYRYTYGADYQTINDNTVSGFNGIVTLKFGKF
ncbi:MAG: hypothetical protein L3J41_01215 [Melioribacteraceae bacterium]|nr:hypothetical protein [Melioribacteraceae bacterium]